MLHDHYCLRTLAQIETYICCQGPRAAREEEGLDLQFQALQSQDLTFEGDRLVATTRGLDRDRGAGRQGLGIAIMKGSTTGERIPGGDGETGAGKIGNQGIAVLTVMNIERETRLNDKVQ